MITMTLHGSGVRQRPEWTELVSTLPNAVAVWADIDGMHRAPLPTELPVGATHLWFWSDGCHGRIRIDGDVWIAGVLTHGDTTAPPLCAVLDRDLTIDRSQVLPWQHAAPGQDADGRVAQFRGDDGALSELVQLVPRRPGTAVFLARAGAYE